MDKWQQHRQVQHKTRYGTDMESKRTVIADGGLWEEHRCTVRLRHHLEIVVAWPKAHVGCGDVSLPGCWLHSEVVQQQVLGTHQASLGPTQLGSAGHAKHLSKSQI
jgi:hypothetical protein